MGQGPSNNPQRRRCNRGMKPTRDKMTEEKLVKLLGRPYHQKVKAILSEFESLESEIEELWRVIQICESDYHQLVEAMGIDFDSTSHPERLALARKLP